LNNMASPLVTVLMPTLNQAEFIQSAIDSVLAQSHNNLELVVMDGGSTDATLSILESIGKQDARLRYFSQTDTGPAQALNRAMAKARGTIIGWLNSDDLYVEGAVARAVAYFSANPAALMVYGEGQHIDREGVVFETYPTLPSSTPVTRFAQGCFICQPTVFFKRTMPLLLGPFDETLKCSFDFEYWLRAFKAFPERIGYLWEVQAQSRFYAGTITMRQRRAVALEGVQVLQRHLGEAPKEWLLTYVDEVLASAELQQGIPDLAAHFAAFFEEAAAWVAPGEIRLAQQLMHKRLHTHGG
jgi:cellulose synthase/poly-beta-1,6-N-acetylglucosamine synthase-like glycosyltransferase